MKRMNATLRPSSIRILGVSTLAALTGCADINSIHRSVDFSSTGYSIDAKQRVIISLPARSGTGAPRVVCAEPSPDVFTVQGSSLSALFGKKEKTSAELAVAMAESGQNIGLRTQSIQLLRDAMYRSCEGAAGGMLTPEEFSELQTRFQKLTAVLLATEQLTGAVRPQSPPVLAVGGNSSTGTKLLEIQSELEAALKVEETKKAKVKEQEAVVEAKTTALNTALGTPGADVTKPGAAKTAKEEADTANAELSTRQKDLMEATENRKALERQREAARSASAQVAGGATIVAVPDPYRGIDHLTATAVSGSVERMVTAIFAQDSASQICLRHYVATARDAAQARKDAEAIKTANLSKNLTESDFRKRLEGIARDTPAAGPKLLGLTPGNVTEKLNDAEARVTALDASLSALDKHCEAAVKLEETLATARSSAPGTQASK